MPIKLSCTYTKLSAKKCKLFVFLKSLLFCFFVIFNIQALIFQWSSKVPFSFSISMCVNKIISNYFIIVLEKCLKYSRLILLKSHQKYTLQSGIKCQKLFFSKSRMLLTVFTSFQMRLQCESEVVFEFRYIRPKLSQKYNYNIKKIRAKQCHVFN